LAACGPDQREVTTGSDEPGSADSGPGGPDAGGDSEAGAVDGGAQPDAGAARDAGMEPRGLATLFVGNSYLFANDIPGMYREALSGRVRPLRVEAVTAGGYTLARHASDLAMDGQPLATYLRTGPAADNAFDFVVLQEQSQIGGFPEDFQERVASLAAARALGARAHQRGATVVLYLTWGRARGDPANPALFSTFTEMQDRLDEGYRAMAAALRADGVRVRLAPVGGAFRLVHDALLQGGRSPLTPGDGFLELYDADGSHPSRRGSYLAACIFAGATTTLDGGALPDDPQLGAAVSASLRATCGQALSDPRWQ
ncbi:MAG: hypothetical protein INH41_18595, partial [Myxococcaceae bacterium]|nr:hypothetical protein [Myxococcaceae bacterium]